MSATRALIVLARHPRAGRVKTRLAATIGDEAAAAIYRAFLDDLSDRLAGDRRWDFFWAFEPAGAPFATEIARGARCFPQRSGDLGERMAGAMREAFSLGYARAVLIGSDLPQLAADRIAAAFDDLERGIDLVLGPAEDGGYYLIGASRLPPVFSGIPWSGEDVLRRTLAAAERAGLSTRLLPVEYDIDTEADLRRLTADRPRADIPATRRALARFDPVTRA